MTDWVLNAAVGLMIGFMLGAIVGLKYIIEMDRKIERLLAKVERLELKTEKEIESKIVKRRKKK
jgi:hypothetical protein